MLNLVLTGKFKKDYNKLKKRKFKIELLDEVVNLLINQQPLPAKYKNHPLKGDKKGYFDLHIQNDWVLIYRIDNNELILYLLETGTHSDILKS